MKTPGLLLLGLASACSPEPREPAVAAQSAAGDALPADVLRNLARVSEDGFSLKGDWSLGPRGNRIDLEVRPTKQGNYRLCFLFQKVEVERRTCTASLSDGVLRLDGPVLLPGSRSIEVLYPVHVRGDDTLLPDAFLPEYEAGCVLPGESEFAFRREAPDIMQPFSLRNLARLSEDGFPLKGDWCLSPQENRVDLEVRPGQDGNYRLCFLIQTQGEVERRTCTASVSDGALRLDGSVQLPGSRSIAMLYIVHVFGDDALVPDLFLPEYEAGRVLRGDSEFAFKREVLDITQPFSGPDDDLGD